MCAEAPSRRMERNEAVVGNLNSSLCSSGFQTQCKRSLRPECRHAKISRFLCHGPFANTSSPLWLSLQGGSASLPYSLENEGSLLSRMARALPTPMTALPSPAPWEVVDHFLSPGLALTLAQDRGRAPPHTPLSLPPQQLKSHILCLCSVVFH